MYDVFSSLAWSLHGINRQLFSLHQFLYVICCDSHFPQWTADGENLARGVSARLLVEEENRSENENVTIPSLKLKGKNVKETDKRPKNATPMSVDVSNGRFLTLSFYHQCRGRGGFRKFTVYKFIGNHDGDAKETSSQKCPCIRRKSFPRGILFFTVQNGASNLLFGEN